MRQRSNLIDVLVGHHDPSIRWKTIVNVLGDDPQSKRATALQEEIRNSPRVHKLLDGCREYDRPGSRSAIYDKWQGAHWVLATLADIGFLPRDKSLEPLRDQILDHWLQDFYYREFESGTKENCYKRNAVPVMLGRHRRCAAQQGKPRNSYATLKRLRSRTARMRFRSPCVAGISERFSSIRGLRIICCASILTC